MSYDIKLFLMEFIVGYKALYSDINVDQFFIALGTY